MDSSPISTDVFLRKRELQKDQFPKQWEYYEDEIIDRKPVNYAICKSIFDDYIVSEMKQQENIYTSYQGLDIWLGTWNVNGKKVDEDISNWLLAGETKDEMVDLTASTVVSESQSQKRSQIWLDMISTTLRTHPKTAGEDYYCVASKILVGIFICVYARISIKPSISNVLTSTAATGLLGMMGNKGGAGIRMTINNSSICFVCSHLAAHRENVSARNADFHKIMSSMYFSSVTTSNGQDKDADRLEILNHDIVFWIGDLNYRITSDVATMAVFDYATHDYTYILKKDQLKVSQQAGLAFTNFVEPVIHFPPTYRYIRFSQEYDQRKEKKLRAPAWCDRVLYHMRDTPSSDQPTSVLITEYDHVPAYGSSDHKPVYAHAVTLVKKYDMECLREIHEDIERKLRDGDKKETPYVVFSEMDIAFGELSYKYCSKHQGVIDDMLAVRVNYDRDYYIHITGVLLPTSFGLSLSTLVRRTQPARMQEVVDMATAPVHAVPAELWSMVDCIYQHGLNQTGLWSTPSSDDDLAAARELLDTGKSLNETDVHVVANMMVEWLDELQIPVIPDSFIIGLEYGKQMSCDFADTLLAMLPMENRNVFVYLMKFLQEVLTYAQWNNLDASFLTTIFSRVFIGGFVDDDNYLNKARVVAQNIVISMMNFLLSPSDEEKKDTKELQEEEGEGESDDSD